jgi:PKD repeat protein
MDRRLGRTALSSAYALLAALALSLLAVSPALARQAAHRPRVGYARTQQVCPPAELGRATCLALVRDPVPSAEHAAVGVESYRIDDGATSAGPAGGLTPAQLASAYAYDPTSGGTGQTVALIEAYDDPKIEEDLASFDTNYGLPACTTANGCFEKVGQSGSATSLPEADSEGWSVEESLDVEVAHSACPQCKILVVEAESAYDSDLSEAVNEAVSLGATEVSNSYGGPEVGIGANEQAAYNHPGVMIAAATGDDGYDDYDMVDEIFEYQGKFYFGLSPEMPNSPASLPTVVAVGGTTLELNENGTRASETVWNNNGRGDQIGIEYGAQGATGGGCSTRFIAQLWQERAPGFGATGCGSKRLAADVAAVANPDTGFDIYDSYECGSYCREHGLGEGWLTIGGTSLSAPLISSLYGLAGGSHGIRYPSLTLYGHLGDSSSLYDVTEGANGFCDGESVAECGDPNGFFGHVDCEGTTACNAAPGFDGPSGVGTPNGLSAFEPLLPDAVITAPSAPKVGIAATFSAASSSDPYPGDSLSSYSWSWGDGTPASSGVSPTHTFAAPGSYTVTLTVTDGYGLTATTTQSIEVTVRTLEEIKEQEEEEAKQKLHEEEEAKQKLHEEEVIKQKLHEEEAVKQKLREEEAVKQKLHEEEATKKQQEEAAAQKKREEERSSSLAVQGVAGFQAHSSAPVPDALLASTTLEVSKSGAVTVKVSCPAAESNCSGTVTLRTLSAVPATNAAAAKRRASILTLASGSFSVAGGKVQTITLHLSSRARTLLKRSKTLRAKATIVAHDLAGATHTDQIIVVLRPVGSKHG